jgi:hypothetical protein
MVKVTEKLEVQPLTMNWRELMREDWAIGCWVDSEKERELTTLVMAWKVVSAKAMMTMYMKVLLTNANLHELDKIAAAETLDAIAAGASRAASSAD